MKVAMLACLDFLFERYGSQVAGGQKQRWKMHFGTARTMDALYQLDRDVARIVQQPTTQFGLQALDRW
jgi:hypothetical protein